MVPLMQVSFLNDNNLDSARFCSSIAEAKSDDAHPFRGTGLT